MLPPFSKPKPSISLLWTSFRRSWPPPLSAHGELSCFGSSLQPQPTQKVLSKRGKLQIRKRGELALAPYLRLLLLKHRYLHGCICRLPVEIVTGATCVGFDGFELINSSVSPVPLYTRR